MNRKIDEFDLPQQEWIRAQVAEAQAFGNLRRRHFQTGELITARKYWDEQLNRGILNKVEYEAGLELLCDVCRIWEMPHPSGCQRPDPVDLV